MATTTLFEGERIKELIPQRNPIMMVDTFYNATENDANTCLTILKDNFFCENGKFTEPGLIEHIAQSASAFAGYTAYVQNKPALIGFIGEVKKFRIFELPAIGSKLRTHIHIISEAMGISLISAETITDVCTPIAECKMKISIKE